MTTALLVIICIILLVICGKIWGIRQSTEDAYEDAVKLASGIQEKYEQQGLYPYWFVKHQQVRLLEEDLRY